MAEVTIEATLNGPYLVTGPIELLDTDGTVRPLRARCGCAAAAARRRSRSAMAPIPRSASRLRHRPYSARPKKADQSAAQLVTDWAEVFTDLSSCLAGEEIAPPILQPCRK